MRYVFAGINLNKNNQLILLQFQFLHDALGSSSQTPFCFYFDNRPLFFELEKLINKIKQTSCWKKLQFVKLRFCLKKRNEN